MNEKDLTHRVFLKRSLAESDKEFSVKHITPMTVLDVLLAISRKEDESLAFRFSCRVGMCGTCLVRVNGKPVLACQQIVSEDMVEIHIEPAIGMPVVRDMVVDTSPFWKQWAKVIPFFVPKKGASEIAKIPHSSPERQEIDPHVDCIQCGACFSACSVAGDGNDFLGPAALNRAYTLMIDSRDDAHEERLAIVQGDSGVWRCHHVYGCSISCPKGLDPVSSIRNIRSKKVEGLN